MKQFKNILELINKLLIIILSIPKPLMWVLTQFKPAKELAEALKGHRTIIIAGLTMVSGALDAFLATGGFASVLCETFGVLCENTTEYGIIEMTFGYIMGYMRLLTNTEVKQ